MKLRTLVSVLLSLGLLASLGCSRKISLELASHQERVPFPRFLARDVKSEGQNPSYSQIKVFDLTDGCKVPRCPVVWQVVVSEKSSPTRIVYGAPPAVGTITIIAPKDLRPLHRYHMVVDSEKGGKADGEGRVNFRIDEHGYLLPEPASKK